MKRSDSFAARFLLDNGCDVNLTSRVTADTALHLICTYSEKSCDTDTFAEMVAIGKIIVENGADLNAQNRKG